MSLAWILFCLIYCVKGCAGIGILRKAKCKADGTHVKKVMDAVVHARKMKNAKQSLEARLSNAFGDKPGKAVFREISKFL